MSENPYERIALLHEAWTKTRTDQLARQYLGSSAERALLALRAVYAVDGMEIEDFEEQAGAIIFGRPVVLPEAVKRLIAYYSRAAGEPPSMENVSAVLKERYTDFHGDFYRPRVLFHKPVE